MVNRWIGILLAGLMLAANASIFLYDVLPHWLPNDVPPNDAQMLGPGDERFVQVGIFNDDGVRIGTSWTTSQRKSVGEFVGVSTVTIFGPVSLPAVTIPRLRIDNDIVLRASTQRVDEVTFKLFGVDLPVQLKGEAMPTGEFVCRWNIGAQTGDLVLDSELPAMLGDVIRPFDRLPNLSIGQTWRLKLVDPLKAVLPQLENTGIEIEPIVFRVTGRDTIQWRGKSIETFVVDGGATTAYVDDEGRVLRQEVTVPLLGRLVLIDEPYSDGDRERAMFSAP